jgi:SET domain-containing protein
MPVHTRQFRGNVARFFNHSCNPNLTKKQVYLGDIGTGYFPRVAFFAARAIAMDEELCMDYGYEEGDVPGACMVCYCGQKNLCRGTLI